MLSSGSILFMLPVIGLVLAITFAAIAVREPMARGAAPGAMAFFAIATAGVIDVQRDALPHALAALVVPLQWTSLLCMMQALLSRHGRGIRWHIAIPCVASALLVHLWFYFVDPDLSIRALNGNAASAIILTITALRHRDLTARMLDRVIYGILASNACFFGLLAAWIARSSSNDLQAEQWIGSQLMLVTYIGGTLMGLIAALAFVIALGMDLVEHHHKSSRIDPLTGLGNRRALDAFVDAQANGAHVFGAALMIDLDHFKAINDTHGHDAGDAVLGAVGLSLQTKLGVFAEITRVGGEEFAVLIRTPYADIAPSLALVARAAIIDAEPAAPHDALRVTASIGLARCAKHEELRAALRRADMALYAAKAGGRDRVIAEEDHNHRVELRAVA